MIKECLHLMLLKKEIPLYYFKFCYRKGVDNYTDYLSSREAIRIKHSTNFSKPEFRALERNKLFFSMFCKNLSLPVPQLGGFNFNCAFYLEGEPHYITNKTQIVSYFEKFFSQTGWDSVFLKPMEGLGGKGCYKINREEIETLDDEIANTLITNSYIHQAVIRQHDKINAIHPGCINTLRLETFKDKKGENHILGAFLRIGTGKSLVDNISAGGFFVGVNWESGTLKGMGHQFMEYGGAEMIAHPETGFVFEGFQIPFFEEISGLIQRAAPFFPDRYLGWDIALTTTGPIIVEINNNPGLFVTDLAYGGYLKHPIFQEIIREAY